MNSENPPHNLKSALLDVAYLLAQMMLLCFGYAIVGGVWVALTLAITAVQYDPLYLLCGAIGGLSIPITFQFYRLVTGRMGRKPASKESQDDSND